MCGLVVNCWVFCRHSLSLVEKCTFKSTILMLFDTSEIDPVDSGNIHRDIFARVVAAGCSEHHQRFQTTATSWC